MKNALILASSLILLCTVAQSERLNDSSDWWSISRKDPRIPNVRPPHSAELHTSNFQVGNVTLGGGGFERIMARFGKATVVERGDASTGRSQACYTSPGNSAIHAVFEFGEDESIFYLFLDGPTWKGSKYCMKSKHVSAALATTSGLKLGLSQSEVEKILGPPDATTADAFVYSREFHKRSTPSEFATFRKEYPQSLSDEEAHQKFDSYPVEQYVLIKFQDSKLVYLAVAISGGAD